jgi:cell division protein FtsW (lipid II flippase)
MPGLPSISIRVPSAFFIYEHWVVVLYVFITCFIILALEYRRSKERWLLAAIGILFSVIMMFGASVLYFIN